MKMEDLELGIYIRFAVMKKYIRPVSWIINIKKKQKKKDTNGSDLTFMFLLP